ncbi:MAG: hypothetical protein AAFY81_06800, partial [Pseudomonadota bacterium]
MGIFFILAISGALGWVEAITAGIVLSAASMAYFVGSTQSEPTQRRDYPLPSVKAGGDIDPVLPTLLSALPVPVLNVG